MSALAADLEPIAAMASGDGPDEHDASRGAGRREFRVLGEEAVTRMDGLRAGAARRVEDHVAAQIAVLGARTTDVHGLVAQREVQGVCVRIGVHADDVDAQPLRGHRHATGDLATICDEEAREHGCQDLSVTFHRLHDGWSFFFERNSCIPSRPSDDDAGVGDALGGGGQQHVIFERRVDDVGKQALGGGQGARAAHEQLLDQPIDADVEAVGRGDFVDESEISRLRGGEIVRR